MNLEYRQSLTEVDTILNFMSEEYINKIPNKLINFIKENKDNSYISDINVNIPINKQILKKDTKILISLLYRNYWCDDTKKQELLKQDYYLKKEYEKEINERYNPDNIFSNKKKNTIKETSTVENLEIVQYKESALKKILNIIKKVLKI